MAITAADIRREVKEKNVTSFNVYGYLGNHEKC